MPDRNDAITFGELTRALEETGLYPKAWATETVPPDGYAKVAEKLFWTAHKYRIEPVANHDDDLTITKKELRDTLERLAQPGSKYPGNFTTAASAATAIVNQALNLRASSRTPEVTNEESITKDQLKNALNIAGYPSDVGYVIRNTEALKRVSLADAADVLWEVKDEPEFKAGEMVMDAYGLLYKRYGAGWLGFGLGTSTVGFGTPRRPLKKVKVVEE